MIGDSDAECDAKIEALKASGVAVEGDRFIARVFIGPEEHVEMWRKRGITHPGWPDSPRREGDDWKPQAPRSVT